jgi:hypothetical protein
MRAIPIEFTTFLTSLLFIATIASTWIFVHKRAIFSQDIRPLFAFIFGSVIYFVEFFVANGFAIVIALLIVCQLYFLYVLGRQPTSESVRASSLHGREILCVVLGVFVLLCMFRTFSAPTQSLYGDNQRFDTSSLLQYSTHSVDNFAHVEHSIYNSTEHRTSYFDKHARNTALTGGSSSAYPQIFNVIHSAYFDIARIANSAIGHPLNDLTVLYGTFLSMQFLVISIVCGLLWKILRSIMSKVDNFPSHLGILFAAAGVMGTLMVNYTMMLAAGFPSQMMVEVALVTFFACRLWQNEDSPLYEKLIVPALLCIAIGNSWWLLLPPYLAAFGLYVICTSCGRLSRKQGFIIKTAFLVVAGIISLIPAISQIFITKTNLVNVSTTDGYSYPISPLLVSVLLVVTSIVLFVQNRSQLFPLSKKKIIAFMRSVDLVYYFLGVFVILFIIYQKMRIHRVNYYANKAMWSSASTFLIVLMIIVSTLLIRHSSLRNFFSKSFVNSATSAILVVLIVTFAVGALNRQHKTFIYGQDRGKLTALADIVKDSGPKDRVVVYSNKVFLEDFMFMNFIDVVRRSRTATQSKYGEALYAPNATDQTFTRILEKYPPKTIFALHGCAAVEQAASHFPTARVYSLHQDGKAKVCNFD